MRFALALHTDDGVAYSAPDLPGCFSAGATLDDAIEMAREAIDAHCELLAEDGEDVALRQPLAVHRANPELTGAVWAVVDVPVDRYFGPAEKINITVPGRILARIDAFARQHGESRSGFLVRTAQHVMRAGSESSRHAVDGPTQA